MVQKKKYIENIAILANNFFLKKYYRKILEGLTYILYGSCNLNLRFIFTF